MNDDCYNGKRECPRTIDEVNGSKFGIGDAFFRIPRKLFNVLLINFFYTIIII